MTAVAVRQAWTAAITAAVVGCLVAGCTAHATGDAAAPGDGSHASAGRTAGAASAGSPSRPVWLLTRSALAEMVADPAIAAGLRRSRVYQLLQPGQQPLAGTNSVPVVTFSAVAALQDAITRGQLPAGTRAVLYDPEVWPVTPVAEQRRPVQAAKRAAQLAHTHGLQFIVAPALNLVTVAAGSTAPRWRQFLDLRLAAAFAPVADVIELQAQSLERSSSTYAQFVRAAARQAQAANPRVTVLAGLSANPPGARVDAGQLTAAIRATRAAVDGYWLNIPGRGLRCPTCNPAQPGVGRQALREVM